MVVDGVLADGSTNASGTIIIADRQDSESREIRRGADEWPLAAADSLHAVVRSHVIDGRLLKFLVPAAL